MGNKTGMPEVGATLRVQKAQSFKIILRTKVLLRKFVQVFSDKNTDRDRHKTRKLPFPQLETTKKTHFFEANDLGFLSFRKSLIVPKNQKRPINFAKRVFSCQNFFNMSTDTFYRKRTVSKKTLHSVEKKL